MRLTIVIPGIPLSKKRARFVPMQKCLGCGKTVQGMYSECPGCGGGLRFIKNISYPDSETVRYENLVAYSIRQAMDKAGMVTTTSGLKMSLVFSFPISESRKCKTPLFNKAKGDPTTFCDGGFEPESFCWKKDCKKLHGEDPRTQRPDLDNCIKSILDGGNGVLYADDDVVVELTAKKMWALEGKTEILVETL